MNRRSALGILCVAALLPRRAFSQPGKSLLMGFLGAESAAAYKSQMDALRAGLRDAGYVEGSSLRIEERWAAGHYDRLRSLADELVRLKVDVIVTHGVPGTRAAKEATSRIPIVMARVGDAVVTDLVPSLARPGGNITGLTFFAPELSAKRVDLVRELLPKAAAIAVLYVPDNPISEPVLYAIEVAARSKKMAVRQFQVRRPNELAAALSAAAGKRVDAVLVPEYSMFIANAEQIARLAHGHRLPAIGFEDFAEAGGLVGYGVNGPEMFRRAAVYVDKIARGARPGDLPVERASIFQLIVNLKAAADLGVSVPQRLLLRADEVIR
jgi:putative ABC transport system substrate-binding protein